MQTDYNDGRQELERIESLEQLTAKLNDPNAVKVTVHKPGSIIMLQSGARYRVADDGSWRRL